MNEPLLNYADLLLRIVKLEARVIALEQQIARGAAPQEEWVQLSDDTLVKVKRPGSPHWVLGEGGGSGPKEIALGG